MESTGVALAFVRAISVRLQRILERICEASFVGYSVMTRLAGVSVIASASRTNFLRRSSSLISARSFSFEQGRVSKPPAPNSYRGHQPDGRRWFVFTTR
jgi:hypothetical protein